MSLFRRATRYRVAPTQDPRENRLTEVTAAVLERVDGLAQEVVEAILASAGDGVLLARVRGLDRPRLHVATQVATASGKFVDLEVRLTPRPFEPGDTFLVWVEIKHGADVHGTQLTDYEIDIRLRAGDHRLVVVLAPLQSTLTGVPSTMPLVDWQAIAEVARRWTRRSDISEVDRFLVRDYLEFLGEEGLMDEELLTTEHAFALRAVPAAVSTVAKVMELTEERITKHWGPRGDKKGGSRSPTYGLDYWAHYDLAAAEGPPAAETWRSTTFEWGLFGDQDRAEPRNAYVFVAGATFYAVRDDPTKIAENADWLAARRKDGFEHVNSWYWRLFRYRYPEELLAETTLDGQVAALGDWVVESFKLLADTPPPH